MPPVGEGRPFHFVHHSYGGRGAIQSTTMNDAAMMLVTGPCLIAALGALALYIVGTSLGSRAHALFWAGAFALLAVQWAILGVAHLTTPNLFASAAAGLIGILAFVLYTHGFRLRRGGPRRDRAYLAVSALILLILITLILVKPMLVTRFALMTGVKAIFLVWAMGKLFRTEEAATPAEWAGLVMMAFIAIESASVPVMQLARVQGHPMTGTSMVVQQAVLIGPATAAMALCTLLLIASDFSAERRRLVHTDPLTGLLNRFGFDRAVAFARRRRRVSVAIADIDHFKAINDQHGHAVGDAVLAGFAASLAGSLHRNETAGRIGGEEFALLLDDGPAEAMARIEAMRAAVSELVIEQHPDIRFTVSFGVAQRAGREAVGKTLGRADEALYQSKREGRNRTTLAEAGQA